ncbi:aldehyde dehydrogenase [Novosphingobium sp. P6W]|uniref:aldehyde dehydrogenase n=1 Tax=Novosphingobium sp. P6W TaxID=1609758 RepID=UPI0005C308AF|nr:aldehyde dehydrogenase [Novosphingobium sp. P6W]AXB75997.1 aldehyde dehydrogenase [Novosphingobium sp. P6W]KIS31196.1 carnitine dehydratase [Novosphingobium sp. P6W]
MTIRKFQMLVDGAWIDAASGRTYESRYPATGEVWSVLPDADEADADRAVRAADAAFRSAAWRGLTATARGKLLRGLGDLVAENAGELAELETQDNGKLIRETRGQLAYLPEFFHYCGGLADKLEGSTLPIDKADMMAFTIHEPLGVVAAIIPWNSPLYLTAIKLAPALAAGNTLVIKPSEHASASILRFAALVEEAGFPAGVVNVVTGLGPSAGAALTRHPLVRRIAFTGGPATARHVIRASAENFAKLSLELGGKSANIVFDDADLESAVNGAVAGIYAASGQSCVAGSRLLVQDGIYDRFVAALTERMARIRIGDPLDPESDMGPMATEHQLGVVETMVDRAREEGAEVLAGGKRHAGRHAGSGGWYYEPTLLACESDQMDVVQNEVFGPVAALMRFRTDAEALALANGTQYALASGVWTRDIGRAHRFVRDVHAGIVWVNTYRAVSAMAPIGGYGASGYGREGGIHSVLDYTELKTVWINLSEQPMGDPFVMR